MNKRNNQAAINLATNAIGANMSNQAATNATKPQAAATKQAAKPRILPDLNQAMLLELAKLRAENAALKAADQLSNGVTVRMNAKLSGIVIRTNHGKYPINILISQADQLFTDDNIAIVKKFLLDNASKFARKF